MVYKKSMEEGRMEREDLNSKGEKGELEGRPNGGQITVDDLYKMLSEVKNKILPAMREEIKSEVKSEIALIGKKIEEIETAVKLQNLRVDTLIDIHSRIPLIPSQPSSITEYGGYARAGTGFNSRDVEWKKNPFL